MTINTQDMVDKSYKQAKEMGVVLDSHFDATGPNFENHYDSDLYKRYIKYKTLDTVFKNEADCRGGKGPASADNALCTNDKYFFGASLVKDYKDAKAEYYELRGTEKWNANDGDDKKLTEDEQKSVDDKGAWGNAAAVIASGSNQDNIGNIQAAANWIWSKKKPIVNDLIRNIDASIKYYEAQHTYSGRLKGVDDMQKIYNENIIGEQDKLIEKKNIFSRLSQYNRKEEDEFNKILPWLRIGYWFCFGTIIFFLVKNEQWKNVKMYAFIATLLFIPAILPALTTYINTEFHASKLKSVYITYIVLGIILIFGLYFTGNLPFVNDSQGVGLQLPEMPKMSDLPKPSAPASPPTMPKPSAPPMSPPPPIK
jgi:hypothetical protein